MRQHPAAVGRGLHPHELRTLHPLDAVREAAQAHGTAVRFKPAALGDADNKHNVQAFDQNDGVAVPIDDMGIDADSATPTDTAAGAGSVRGVQTSNGEEKVALGRATKGYFQQLRADGEQGEAVKSEDKPAGGAGGQGGGAAHFGGAEGVRVEGDTGALARLVSLTDRPEPDFAIGTP